LCKKGYLRVYLSIGSKKHTKRIHRLIALTFVENPDKKETVNHIDCNKLNNHVSNLEWMTNQENMRHAFDNGIYKDRDKIRKLYKNKKCN
jgi:type IV secretory pathway VirB9-like protein